MVSGAANPKSAVAMSARPAKLRSPMKSLPVPNARLKPTSTHSTLIRPMAKKFCMSMASRFLDRTIPP